MARVPQEPDFELIYVGIMEPTPIERAGGEKGPHAERAQARTPSGPVPPQGQRRPFIEGTAFPS